MERVECPTPAYNALIESGIYHKILEKQERIKDVLLFRSIYEGDWKILERARKEIFNVNKKISHLDRAYRDILILERCMEEDRLGINFNEIMLKNPSFLGFLVLEEELVNFEKYGFPSRKSLEESITSFCFGERHLIMGLDREHCWRNKDYKNQVVQNEHGDLYVSQKDVSGKSSIDQTLFGKLNTFDTMKINPPVGVMSEYQDWSNFLASVLKYAKAIGKEKMHEIVNWESILKEVGARGTNTAECMFGGSGIDVTSFVMQRAILKEGKDKYEYSPLIIGDRKYASFPFVTKEGKLIYLQENEEGAIFPEGKNNFLKDLKLKKELIFDEKDLPHLLKANYRFFARDRTVLPKMMDNFLGR